MIIRSLAHALSPGGPRARLTVLIFHRVHAEPDPLLPGEPDAQRFQVLMGWLKRWFQVLPLDQAVQLLQAGRLPARAAAISFDDGYANNATQALPVLRHLGLPATFFIATSFLNGGRMWNDTVIEALRRTSAPVLDLRHCALGLHALHTLPERRGAIDRLLALIKHLSPGQRQEAVLQVQDAARVALPDDLMLRTAQLLELRDSGMQIGAHTVTHPILQCSTEADARWEIAHSKQVLEQCLGEQVSLFAYPNGRPETDYAASHVAMVRAAGFRAAFSTACGAATLQHDLLQLPRFTPWDRGRLRFGLRMVANLRQPPLQVATHAAAAGGAR